MLKIQEIKEILEMVNQSSVQRFELECEATKLVIVKSEPGSAKQTSATSAVFAEEHNEKIDVRQDQATGKIAEEPAKAKLHKIVSPMAGTFYCAPEPGADPFVKIGQKVNANTVVCVLEAMKLFNETEAEVNGEVVEILVKDGEFVEYGQTLFLVKPD